MAQSPMPEYWPMLLYDLMAVEDPKRVGIIENDGVSGARARRGINERYNKIDLDKATDQELDQIAYRDYFRPHRKFFDSIADDPDLQRIMFRAAFHRPETFRRAKRAFVTDKITDVPSAIQFLKEDLNSTAEMDSTYFENRFDLNIGSDFAQRGPIQYDANGMEVGTRPPEQVSSGLLGSQYPGGNDLATDMPDRLSTSPQIQYDESGRYVGEPGEMPNTAPERAEWKRKMQLGRQEIPGATDSIVPPASSANLGPDGQPQVDPTKQAADQANIDLQKQEAEAGLQQKNELTSFMNQEVMEQLLQMFAEKDALQGMVEDLNAPEPTPHIDNPYNNPALIAGAALRGKGQQIVADGQRIEEANTAIDQQNIQSVLDFQKWKIGARAAAIDSAASTLMQGSNLYNQSATPGQNKQGGPAWFDPNTGVTLADVWPENMDPVQKRIGQAKQSNAWLITQPGFATNLEILRGERSSGGKTSKQKYSREEVKAAEQYMENLLQNPQIATPEMREMMRANIGNMLGGKYEQQYEDRKWGEPSSPWATPVETQVSMQVPEQAPTPNAGGVQTASYSTQPQQQPRSFWSEKLGLQSDVEIDQAVGQGYHTAAGSKRTQPWSQDTVQAVTASAGILADRLMDEGELPMNLIQSKAGRLLNKDQFVRNLIDNDQLGPLSTMLQSMDRGKRAAVLREMYEGIKEDYAGFTATPTNPNPRMIAQIGETPDEIDNFFDFMVS